jgi:hypothetical protein
MSIKRKKSPRRKKPIRRRQIKLPIVRSWPTEVATILDIKHPAPLFLGDDREDLLCGTCRTPLAVGVSMTNLRALFNTPVQLLVKCPKCRSLSYLDAKLQS